MEPRPTEVVAWAEETVDEFILLNGVARAVTSKTEPSAEVKTTGVRARQPLVRQIYNWLFNFHSRWIRNLDERTSGVGRIELTTDNTKTASDYDTQFGGTWTSRGTQLMGTVTVNVFERTS